MSIMYYDMCGCELVKCAPRASGLSVCLSGILLCMFALQTDVSGLAWSLWIRSFQVRNLIHFPGRVCTSNLGS